MSPGTANGHTRPSLVLSPELRPRRVCAKSDFGQKDAACIVGTLRMTTIPRVSSPDYDKLPQFLLDVSQYG